MSSPVTAQQRETPSAERVLGKWPGGRQRQQRARRRVRSPSRNRRRKGRFAAPEIGWHHEACSRSRPNYGMRALFFSPGLGTLLSYEPNISPHPCTTQSRVQPRAGGWYPPLPQMASPNPAGRMISAPTEKRKAALCGRMGTSPLPQMALPDPAGRMISAPTNLRNTQRRWEEPCLPTPLLTGAEAKRSFA